MSDKAVEVRNLSVRYRNASRAALEGIDLAVSRGELVAALGGTGAGKTTLCRAVSGLVPHAIEARVEGSVRVDGQDVATSTVAQLSRHVGSVFQDAESQIFGLTVESDVAFGLENFAVPPKEIRTRVDEALRQVRMESLAERPSYELSGGQKQRLVIAAALAMRPPVMVLDEPTAELDPVGKKDLLELLAELARQGTAVLVAEQMTDGLAETFDRAFVLEDGHLVASGPAYELLGEVSTLQRAGVRPPQVALALHLALPEERRVPARMSDALPYIHARMNGNPAVGRRVSSVTTDTVRPGVEASETAIEAENVSYVYPGSVTALRGVSLRVGQGEMVALVGENGAGKSTFARHLNGLLRPQTGSLRIAGADTRDMSVAELARRVGYVFQNPDHQVWAETVGDDLTFGPRNLGFDEEATASAIERAVEAVELRASLDEHPNLLGQGERQKLAIAGILAMDPDILILDEPTTGLDWPATRAMMALITKLREDGHTVVIITHDMWVLAEYVPRTVVMSGGKVTGDGPTPEILSDEALLAGAYLEAPMATKMSKALGFPASGAPALGAMLRRAFEVEDVR